MMDLRKLLTAPLVSQNIVAAVLVRVIVVGAAITLLIMGAQNLYYGEHGDWIEVKAKVIDNESHSSNPVVYTPVLTYIFNGHEYHSDHGLIATEGQYPIGSEVSILLNPTNPSETYQRNASRLWALVLLGGVMLPLLRIGVKTIIELVHLKFQEPSR